MSEGAFLPDYEDKFLGADLGYHVGITLAGISSDDPDKDAFVAVAAQTGLRYCYGSFDRAKFLQSCEQCARITPGIDAQAVTVVAAAVRAMCRDEVMPEDLMSAAIDFLPPGLFEDNPYRAKLIAAQDYLEERQTLVNNIEAGDLDVDMFEIDLRNVRRCGTGGTLPEAIGAAFYIVTACKESFEKAMLLALGSKSVRQVPILVGAIAGAQHGASAIPSKWLEKVSTRHLIENQARSLNAKLRAREANQ